MTKTDPNNKPARPPLRPENIPDEIKALSRWVVWGWEWRKNKWSKPPKQTNGREAKSNDPATWCTFDEAVAAFRASRLDGIGVVLPDGVVGFDLDNMRSPCDGTFSEFAQMVLARMQTYTEVSPSGTGIKGLAFGQLSNKLTKIDHVRNVELYDGEKTNRYFCITGDVVDNDHRTITGQREALHGLQAIITDPLEPEAVSPAEADPQRRQKAIEALQHLSEDRAGSYQEWIIAGMAAKSVEDSHEMFEAWCDFSAKSGKYDGPEACEEKWDSFSRRDGTIVSLGTLLRMAKQDGWDPDRPKIRFIKAAEFAVADYSQKFLIPKVLVAGQPAIVGGPSKAMKTTFLSDLAIALGTGTSFLNNFRVPKQVTVATLSGESGAATLQETAKRIAEAKDVKLSESSTYWGFDLPQLSKPVHLSALVDAIGEAQAEVVIIDPAYLCLLESGVAESAGNVFKMGTVLKDFAKVGTETGSTLILAHHTTKASARLNDPLTLEDLSQSGFAEFARQWMLINRRKPYEHGTGDHELWLSIGGSAGHSGLYAVDANEGQINDDFTGRDWRVFVRPAHVMRSDQKQQKETNALQETRNLIVAFLQGTPGDTRSAARDAISVGTKRFSIAWDSLVDDATLVPTKVRKANKQTYDGFVLNHSVTRTGHSDNGRPSG